MSTQLKLLVHLCNFTGFFSATLSANLAYKIWIKTARHAPPPRELEWQSRARMIEINENGLPIVAYEWGKGATVLLVHGWGGRGTQLGAIALALAKHGYRAVAIDLPGHGKTPGSQTNAIKMAAAIKCVTQFYGDIHGIVTHSFGVFPFAILLRDGLSVKRIICISPPDNLLFLLDLFCQWLDLSDNTIDKLRQKIEKEFGSDVWKKISPDFNVSNLAAPALIIHDKNDQEVPWQRGQALANHWPNALFHLTAGLGHRRILRHNDVIEKIVTQLE